MSKRRDLILRKAVAELSRMSDPFATSFLVENGVTLDECGDLADDLAVGGRLVLRVRREMYAGGLTAQAATRLLAGALIDWVREKEAAEA